MSRGFSSQVRPLLGSLCSGAGGLDLAVESVFGAETAWHCEIDAAASRVLKERWPGVPNHGDLTSMADAWGWVEPVDILAGGYPCQPFSSAGQRKGTDDERHIWPHIREAIRLLRPRVVVLENVAGHRSLGFDRVLGDMAEDGLHVWWTSIRAAEVGAPHGRERVFIVAYPEKFAGCVWDGDDVRAGWRERRHEPTTGGGSLADTDGGRCEVSSQLDRDAASTATDGSSHRRHPDRRVRSEVDLLPTPNASDGTGGGQHPDRREGHSRQLIDYVLLCTPSAADGAGGHLSRSGPRSDEPLLPGQAREMVSQWGKYEPAIRRWEELTRPAPSPTEPNRNGNPRLSARFSEWLMGWPEGWVTDVPGISRNDQLRIIGNGVVPQQAIAALSWLLSVSGVAA